MNVERLMAKEVKSCRLEETLKTAALIMWDNDCGIVPVLDERSRIAGLITDRDICMAACLQDARLNELPVRQAMCKEVYSCKPNDSIEAAEMLMRQHQVRRLPVVDEEGRCVGLIALNDIVREADRERAGGKKREVSADGVTETLAAICEPRFPTRAAAVA